MAKQINRREFIKRSAVTGATASLALHSDVIDYTRNDSPSERITLGYIGVGARAQDVMNSVLRMPGFEVVAVCDAYQGRLERAVERTGGRAKVYKNAAELLAAPGV